MLRRGGAASSDHPTDCPFTGAANSRSVQLTLRLTLSRMGVPLLTLCSHYDLDHDGSITKAQWRKVIRSPEVAMEYVSKADVDELFDRLLADGEEQLPYRELPRRLRLQAKSAPLFLSPVGDSDEQLSAVP